MKLKYRLKDEKLANNKHYQYWVLDGKATAIDCGRHGIITENGLVKLSGNLSSMDATWCIQYHD